MLRHMKIQLTQKIAKQLYHRGAILISDIIWISEKGKNKIKKRKTAEYVCLKWLLATVVLSIYVHTAR